MALDRIINVFLRAVEVAFGAIVIGLSAWWIHHSSASAWGSGRMIYTLVVASLATLMALIWLIPMAHSFIHFIFDFIMFILFIIAFGLIVGWLNAGCGGIFNWSYLSLFGDLCGRIRALEAFTFLSAMVWLASALFGLWFMHKRRRNCTRAVANGGGGGGGSGGNRV